jgi:histidinol-phosphate aminotransferase
MNERSSESGSVARYVAAVVRPEIRALRAYAVADATGFIKLDANENPFPLPAAVQARIAAAVASVPINRYPDGGADAVIAALRASLALPDLSGLILGNGSDELIQMITVTLARPGAVMLVPEPTFVMYRANALYAGMRFVGVPLRADFSLDIDAMLTAITREQPALIFLASPNNPTGNLFAEDDVVRILRAAPGLVVVDEAYCAFADTSFLQRAGEFGNLLLLRTLSKIGGAGLRLGYAIAAPEWIAELNKVRQPYNLNALTQAAAPVLLAEADLLAQQAAMIKAERSRLMVALGSLSGVQVFPSQANFVVVRVSNASACFDRLQKEGILVKNLHGSHSLLAECLRITVGIPAENDALLAALKKIA